MAAPLVSALSYLLTPVAARQLAERIGVPEEALPSPVATGLGALANLYGLYSPNTSTPEEFRRLYYGTGPAYDPRNYLDPGFDASMQDLYAERDRAMDYGYAYPQPDMVQPSPPGYIQPTEEELRGLGAGGANGGLAALIRRPYA